MFKGKRVFLIFLLGLLNCVTCSDFDDDIKQRISYLSGKMGSCKEYFQYQHIDEFINGKLELPHIKMGDTVKLTFYRDAIDTDQEPRFSGILLPDDSSQKVTNKIKNGQFISYRVDFPLTYNVPELNKIFVNFKEICTTEHTSSEDILILKHTMKTLYGSLPVFRYNINIPNFMENPTCGHVDEEIAINKFTPLIYGGSEIVRGEFPWLAAIYEKQRTGIDFLCGGSLVTSRIILTAAHCFEGAISNADKILAILGRHNLSNYLEDSYVINEIETLVLHPEYKTGLGFSDADLALLKMKNYVSFTHFIKPICLWFGPIDESLVTNQTGVVAGWGSDEDGYTLSAVPKKVKMDIATEIACLRSSPANITITTPRTLCAGNRDDSGPCEGDSGGGLMINRNGRWMLRGVVSAALINQNRCVFCDIAKHTKWLEKYVGIEQFISGPTAEICGISGTDLRSEHPWLAAVYRKVPTGVRFLYTGTLISSRTVLTRASSVVNNDGEEFLPDKYRIYLGRYNLNNIQENDVVTRDVANFIFHPDYNKTALSDLQENGIVIIQMKTFVDFTEYVKPICLWSKPNDGQSYIVEQLATLSGWDSTGVFQNSFTVPTSIKVNITSIEQCQSWGYDESMASSILCISRLDNENGAILMIKRNERWLLRGINALISDFTTYTSKEFFVYFDLEKYMAWIQKNMLS